MACLPRLPPQLRRHRAADRSHHRRRWKRRGPTADANTSEGASGHLQRPRRAAQRLSVRRRPREQLEHEWPAAYAVHIGYLQDSIKEWDPTYDPNRDGQVSLDELKAWNPYRAPAKAQAEMRLLDLTGDLRRPIIVGQGTADPIVTAKEAPAYQQLVAHTVRDDDPLRTYLIPQLGHGGAAAPPFVKQALDALEHWITHRQSGGTAGSLPGRITGLEPLPDP